MELCSSRPSFDASTTTGAGLKYIVFSHPQLRAICFPDTHFYLLHSLTTNSSPTMFKSLAVLALAASASAFAPGTAPFGARVARTGTPLYQFEFGEYDDQLWDNTAKVDIYNKWDPAQPRSTRNFNPFETHKGNTPDASGIFPGENRYKDPKRGDVSYAIMQAEKAEADGRAANPKPGDVPGAPGRVAGN